MKNDSATKKQKQIINIFFEDLEVLFAVIPIGIIICYSVIAQAYELLQNKNAQKRPEGQSCLQCA